MGHELRESRIALRLRNFCPRNLHRLVGISIWREATAFLSHSLPPFEFLKCCTQAGLLIGPIGPKNDGGTYFTAEGNKKESSESEASELRSKFVLILVSV